MLKVSASRRSNRSHRNGWRDTNKTSRNRQQDWKRVVNYGLDYVADRINDLLNNVTYRLNNVTNSVNNALDNTDNRFNYCAHF
jgi:hypothetical protein